MLLDRDIIIFADDWGRHPSTPQHLASVLLDGNRVLWVNSFGFRAPRLAVYDLKRVVDKISQVFSRPANHAAGSFTVLNPVIPPFYDTPAVRSVNDRLLLSQVRRATSKLGMRNPVLLFAHPLVAGILGQLGESSSHYLCLDDYPSLPGSYKCAADLEKAVLERVDAVFSVSESLRLSRKPKSGEGHFLPQGIDISHFLHEDGAVAPELAQLGHPIVGFHGLISEWVDVELIAAAANAYPAMTFVVIGHATVDVSVLDTIPNVHRLEHVPYATLSRYLAAFDAGLIPFKVNALTIASNPLKTVEYLAMGIPVVSTDLPEVRRFAPWATVATNRNEFVGAIATAVHANSPDQRRSRRRKAELFSWSSVAEAISVVIERVEKSKQDRGEDIVLPAAGR
jgi:glycosyltransferase involved in cell wall biosynthesis